MAKRRRDQAPRELSTGALAKALGVTREAPRLWAAEGAPHDRRAGRLYFNLLEVKSWRLEHAAPDLRGARFQGETAEVPVPKEAPVTKRIPLRKLVKVLRVPEGTIRGWLAEGLPHAARDGEPAFVLAEVESWIASRKGPGEPQTLAEARFVLALEEIRRRRATADKLEHENAVAKGLYYSREQVDRDWLARVLSLRASLLALPALLSSTVARAEPHEVESRSMEEVRRVLTTLSQGGPPMPMDLLEQFERKWRAWRDKQERKAS